MSGKKYFGKYNSKIEIKEKTIKMLPTKKKIIIIY